MLAGDLTTFTSLLAEVAPIEDGGQTKVVIYRQKQPRKSHKRALGGQPIK